MGTKVLTSAEVAIYAAKNFKKWGRYPTFKYIAKRTPFALYRLARQLEAVKEFVETVKINQDH